MKTLMLSILFLIAFNLTFAPSLPSVAYIDIKQPIRPFESLWKATCTVESNHNQFAVNKTDGNGGSFGIVQIGQSKLTDFNNANGTCYELKDCFDIEISKMIFNWHCSQYMDLETASKAWNGSGPITDDYYKLILAAEPDTWSCSCIDCGAKQPGMEMRFTCVYCSGRCVCMKRPKIRL